MPGPKFSIVRLPESEEYEGIDLQEVDEVLATLRELLQTVTSPPIRQCLETTLSDIAHLATVDDDLDDDGLEDDDLDGDLDEDFDEKA